MFVALNLLPKCALRTSSFLTPPIYNPLHSPFNCHHHHLFLHSLLFSLSKTVLLSLSKLETMEMAMEMNSFLDDESFNVDKLSHKIFSLLENKFLFGSTESKNFEKNLNKIDAGKVRILSIDAGGSTDGILAARSLAFVESCLRRKHQNPDARIADYFDAAAGSGVGGILVALLFTRGQDSRPMFKAEEALQFLVKNHRSIIHSSSSKGGVFRKMFKSSKSSKGEKIIRRIFGESTLKDTVKPVLIPCYDLSTRAPFLFSRSDAMENDGFDFKMSEVCAATLADPSVAGAFKLSSVDRKTRIVAVDGGVAMNNPTAAAITHVLNNKQEFPFCDSVEDLLVVSLGNGVSNSSSVPNFVKIGGEAASDMVDESVSMAFGGFLASNYVRIQGNGSGSDRMKILQMAEEMIAQKNVESVLFRGKKLAEKTNSDKLEWFAGELIKEQERRKMSVFATVMIKQTSPRTSSATVSTESSY